MHAGRIDPGQSWVRSHLRPGQVDFTQPHDSLSQGLTMIDMSDVDADTVDPARVAS